VEMALEIEKGLRTADPANAKDLLATYHAITRT